MNALFAKMSDLLQLFSELSKFFDLNLNLDHVDAAYTQEIESRKNSDEPKRRKSTNIASIFDLAIVRNKHNALPALKDLASNIRNLRTESQDSYDNTYDSWDCLSANVPRDAYLAFIYALTSLTLLEPTSADNAKISIAAVQTYFLTLTIPGAKGYAVFDESLIEHCIKVYGTLKYISSYKNQASNIWISFHTLSEDVKLLFRLVHFNDHIELRNVILLCLIDILYMNFKDGYANSNAAHLHFKCFDIFDEAINTHNGDVQDTLMLLMNRTVQLHTYPDRPKGGVSRSNDDCEHIAEWFLKIIPKYPERLCHVLNFYIEWLVTNPLKSWKTEQVQRAMDFAAKYDAALFTKCNKSCAEFLCQALSAEESSIRIRAIELIGRILQIESNVNWQMFRDEIANIPREVFLIKGLLDSLKDCNNNARNHAVQALQLALTRGSPIARKILTQCIRYTQFNDPGVTLPDEPVVNERELRFKKPSAESAAYTFVGYELLELSFLNMPSCVYERFLRCSISNLRRNGIMFMEQVVRVNPLIIYNTSFISEAMMLATDPVAMVRRQALKSVDALLDCYPNCFVVICAWCHIWASLLSDLDPKNTDFAIECFRQRVLLNLKGIDHSNKPEHFMPWIIVRVLLSTQPRHYLQKCIQKSLSERYVNQKLLSIIESHLLASTSTEAWALLNFISGKIKSSEPDALITHFTAQEKWNAEVNMGICLEVLINCLPHFSHAALNSAFEYVLKSIREGRVLLSLISKAMDFLVEIDSKSRSKTKDTICDSVWLNTLHNELVTSINDGMEIFPENFYTFQGRLGAYSEVINMLPERSNRRIVKFVELYMTKCMKLNENDYGMENERVFNWIIVIATRLALRDYEDACNTCRIFKIILRNNDRPQIVNTILVSLGDLGKRHTQLVEDMFSHLLRKLSSPYSCNRIATFKCFEIMVMQDQIKLRGTVLLALLAVLVDEEYKVAQLANIFFENYIKHKNATLFHKCLAECPFVLNEYKNFVGMDSFQGAGGTLKSPLKGEDNSLNRRLLYNHFMAGMDEINLVLHFEQLKFIAEKCKIDPLLKTSDGLAVVKDLLFILRRICYVTKQHKAAGGENKNDEDDDDETAEQPNTSEAINSTQPSTSTGRGRGRKQQKLTMPDALRVFERSLVYIHTIYKNLEDVMDESLQKSFDNLCNALAKRFTSYIDYAQPAPFWNKYRKSKMTSTKKATKRKKNKEVDDEEDAPDDDDDIDEDRDVDMTNEEDNGNDNDTIIAEESDSDNELPLARHNLSTHSLQLARQTCDKLLTHIVFNPHRL